MIRRPSSSHRAAQIKRLDPEVVEMLRSKSGTERMQIASGMFRAARRFIESRLREEHPEWDDETLQGAVARCIAEYPDERKWPVWVVRGSSGSAGLR